ncbi:MAG: HNH endonuclease [Sphingomonadaceae bacterium]|nr:HNH endonuclease [Sphingomonadaceae bacterium]
MTAANLSIMTKPTGKKKKIGSAAAEILELLKKHPEGLTAAEIRAELGDTGTQEQLMRRLRDLRKHFHVPYGPEGGKTAYRYKGEKAEGSDAGSITGKQRARILNLAKGRCQMCGRSVDEDHIKLQVDHRIPQTWGGTDDDENLWAICVQCNHGKRDFFESFDPDEMAELVAIESVHERIARFLKMHEGKAIDSNLIEDIANVRDRQEDWQKRLRELRYPVVGLEIETGRYKTDQGFWRATYKLVKWAELPPDHQKLIKDWEKPAKRAEIKQRLGIA